MACPKCNCPKSTFEGDCSCSCHTSPTPQRKTVEEVAKGLAYDVALSWCKEQHQKCEKADELIPLIIESLTAFAEQEVKEAIDIATTEGAKAVIKAHNEALEEAAVICKNRRYDECAKEIRGLKR